MEQLNTSVDKNSIICTSVLAQLLSIFHKWLSGGTELPQGGGSSRSSDTTSPLSMLSSSTSEGVVVGHSDSEETSEDGLTAVDGLVLMGSTRLRPAPESGIDCDSKEGSDNSNQ